MGLAFIAGLHAYRAYERRVAEQAEQPDGFTFNQVPVRHVAPTVELPVVRRFPADGKTAQEDIFLEQPPLAAAQAQEQARQTIVSILADYKDDAQLQAFHADLAKATGAQIGLADLSGENMTALLQQYPQIQPVIARYMQDPQFNKTLQEIFTNPQFVQSVAVLQQHAGQK